jgi:hypothetical protein
MVGVGTATAAAVTDFLLGCNGFDEPLRTDALGPADFGPAGTTRTVDLVWLFGPAVLRSTDFVRSTPALAPDADAEGELSAHAVP